MWTGGGHLCDQGGMELALAILDSCSPETLGAAVSLARPLLIPGVSEGSTGVPEKGSQTGEE